MIDLYVVIWPSLSKAWCRSLNSYLTARRPSVFALQITQSRHSDDPSGSCVPSSRFTHTLLWLKLLNYAKKRRSIWYFTFKWIGTEDRFKRESMSMKKLNMKLLLNNNSLFIFSYFPPLMKERYAVYFCCKFWEFSPPTRRKPSHSHLVSRFFSCFFLLRISVWCYMKYRHLIIMTMLR